MQPSLLIHGPMVGQVTDNSASFWFRTDGPCEIGVEINGHSGRESILTEKKEGYVGVVKVDGLLPGTYFSYDIFVNGEKYEDEKGSLVFVLFQRSKRVLNSRSLLVDVPVLFLNMNPSGNGSPIMIQGPC